MARTSVPKWLEPFLAALARTGNVRVSSAEAGVDFSTAYARRQRDAGFRAAWAEVVRAREAGALRDGLSTGSIPPQDERVREELVVRCSSTGAAPKLVRAGAGRWSTGREERFIVSLATSANVRRAAAAAGISTQAVYKRRLKQPGFAAAWDAAIEVGKARIEAYLVEAADRTFDPETLGDAVFGGDALPKISVAEAIHILRLKGGAARAVATVKEDDEGEAYEAEVEAARGRFVERLERMEAIARARKIAEGWSEQEGELVPPGFARLEGPSD